MSQARTWKLRRRFKSIEEEIIARKNEEKSIYQFISYNFKSNPMFACKSASEQALASLQIRQNHETFNKD